MSTNLVQNATSPTDGGWTPEQRELLDRVRAFTPEQRAAALAATRASFSREDLAEIKRSQAQLQQELERIAACETLQEQEETADVWWREHITRPRVVRRITANTTPVRTVAIIKPRQREHRPAAARRSASSSTSSGSDPGDLDADHPAPSGCERCGPEVCWSVQLAAWVCERCYAEGVAR